MVNSQFWEILRTRSRQEKIVGRALVARELEHWLPVRRLVKRYGRLDVLVEEPVFPSFVFVKFTDVAQRCVLKSPEIESRLVDTTSLSQNHPLHAEIETFVRSLKSDPQTPVMTVAFDRHGDQIARMQRLLAPGRSAV